MSSRDPRTSPPGPTLGDIAERLRTYADLLDGKKLPEANTTTDRDTTRILNGFLDANPEMAAVFRTHDRLSSTTHGFAVELFSEFLSALAAFATEPNPDRLPRSSDYSREDAALAISVQKIRRQEANALTAIAFRNGYLEDLHAGVPTPLLDDPDNLRITNTEMKRLMVESSRKLYEMLCKREDDPERYAAEIAYVHRRLTHRWDQST